MNCNHNLSSAIPLKLLSVSSLSPALDADLDNLMIFSFRLDVFLSFTPFKL